jgi:hypothetical protein
MLLRAARREAARRGPRVQITGPELEDLACQAAGDALLAITQKVAQFRGESRFTTWAYKFVLFEVAMDMLYVYADLVAAGVQAEQRYLGIAAHLRACGPCGEDFEGLLAVIAGERP